MASAKLQRNSAVSLIPPGPPPPTTVTTGQALSSCNHVSFLHSMCLVPFRFVFFSFIQTTMVVETSSLSAILFSHPGNYIEGNLPVPEAGRVRYSLFYREVRASTDV